MIRILNKKIGLVVFPLKLSGQSPNYGFCESPQPGPEEDKKKKLIIRRRKHPLQQQIQMRMKITYKSKLQCETLYQQILKAKEAEQQQKKNQNGSTANMKEGEKKQQQKQEKQQKEGQKKQTKRPSIGQIAAYLIFGYLLFFSGSDKKETAKSENQENSLQNIEIRLILGEIMKSPNQFNIKISRDPISYRIIAVFEQSIPGQPVKKQIMRITEASLVDLLKTIQENNLNATIDFPDTELRPKSQSMFLKFLPSILTFSIIGFILYRMKKGRDQSSGGGNFDPFKMFASENLKPLSPEKIKLRFTDVAGMHEAKFQITQFVDFLKKPEKYIEMGAKVPKGALLTGPPGTGKTLLAKACAGEAGVPFFSVSGSDFIQKYSGLGASRVRTLFDNAEKAAPSIIFIDEIDAIGKKRDSGPFSNEERDTTLNQLLVRMDGFDTKNKVIVMAATNRRDMLDPALLRPGRFDRSVEIGLPGYQQRVQILKVHLKKIKYDTNFTQDELAKKIARITPGFSGAQLANICNEAAILASRDKLKFIPIQKFQKATERVMAGLERRNMFTEQEKQLLSFYEAGKAVVNWFTQGADPVIKISILPFSKSKAGYSHSIKDETALNTKQQLYSKICCYLAGRSAEKYFKGYTTTNGNGDLEKAKFIIRKIVTKFGMSQPFKMYAFPDFDFTRKPYSDKIQSMIDDQVLKITQECQKRVEELIKLKENEIKKVQERLIEKETLNHNQIKQLIGDRPFSANENYQQFLKDGFQDEGRRSVREPGAGVASG